MILNVLAAQIRVWLVRFVVARVTPRRLITSAASVSLRKLTTRNLRTSTPKCPLDLTMLSSRMRSTVLPFRLAGTGQIREPASLEISASSVTTRMVDLHLSRLMRKPTNPRTFKLNDQFLARLQCRRQTRLSLPPVCTRSRRCPSTSNLFLQLQATSSCPPATPSRRPMEQP